MRCGLRDVGVLFESISLDEAQNARGGSVVPPGLYSFLPLFPALKRWAKLGRPPGLTSVAVSRPGAEAPGYFRSSLRHLAYCAMTFCLKSCAACATFSGLPRSRQRILLARSRQP